MSKITNCMKDVNYCPSSLRILIRPLIETLPLSFLKSNTECKELASFINISLRSAITQTRIWKPAFRLWKLTLNNKEWIHGSKRLPLYYRLTQRSISKNLSGEWNTIWTLQELSIMLPSSLRSRRCLIISENTTNLICSDPS